MRSLILLLIPCVCFGVSTPNVYYDLGLVRDMSENGNTATNHGVELSETSDGWVGDFNGVDDYLSTFHTNLNTGTNSFTVIAKIKTTKSSISSSQAVYLRGRRYAGGSRFSLLVSSSIVYVNVDDNSYNLYEGGGAAVTDGEWHIIAGARTQSDRVVAYRDGVIVVDVDCSALGNLDDTTNIGAIGIANSDADTLTELPFDGEISFVDLYMPAISSNDVYTISNGGTITNEPIANWTMQPEFR